MPHALVGAVLSEDGQQLFTLNIPFAGSQVHYPEEPPDVAAAFVVVVVGAVVVVVVLAVVVVNDDAFSLPSPVEDVGSDVLVVVLDDADVLAVLPVWPEDVVAADELPAFRTAVVLPPGSSVATTRPIRTVAPVAPTTAPRVTLRSRARVLALAFRWSLDVGPMAIALLVLEDEH